VSAYMRDTLHWLSYPQRIIFKLCLFTYKCLRGLAPPYLSRYCQPLSAHSGRSQLRSAEVHQLFVPRIHTTVTGSRGFYYAAPASWNDLPPLLRDPNLTLTDLWSPYVIGQTIYIFMLWFVVVLLLLFLA